MLRFLPIFLALANLAQAEGKVSFEKDIQPLLQKYCWDCHGDGAKKGELNLDPFKDQASILKSPKIWESVYFNIDNWIMPPAKDPQPTPAERETLSQYLENVLHPFDPNSPDPGRVTLRRLNRVEYNNTMRDLLGITSQPANEFPEDDTGYGFDVIGEVLALPPILMERYLSASDKVLDEAFHSSLPASQEFNFGPVALTGEGSRRGKAEKKEVYTLTSNGGAGGKCFFPASGTYQVKAKVFGDQAGPEPVKIEFFSDGQSLGVKEVKANSFDRPDFLKIVAEIPAGSHRISVRFLNDYYDGSKPAGLQDRNLNVIRLSVEGPVKVKDDDPSKGGMARLILSPIETMGEKPEAAKTVLQVFANRAFRRPTQPAEIARLMTIFQLSQDKGSNFKESLVNAMKAVLVSPYFIYRAEWQPEPNNAAQVVELSEMALASRLSYFLWSSMPDDELFKLANANELRKNLTSQVKRMLKSPKAKAFVQNFGGQWLETRTLEVVQPDAKTYRFPAFLRDAMRTEAEELFWNIIQENRPVMEFISADYGYLNEVLARHYGVPGVFGDNFRKVTFPSHIKRRGVLTLGSVLTITSDPTRTSPVKRGKWIMENLLGIPAPPPPPNVPTLDDAAHKNSGQTVRQRLEIHRSKPGCASCHSLIDPLGFGLESFDPIGASRALDNGVAIDSTGILTTGQKFTNAVELAQIITSDKRENFLRCLTQKALIYALGRGLENYDRPAVDGILTKLKKDDLRMESLILGIVESLPFQKRRGDSRKAPMTK